MPISTLCQACQTRLTVPDAALGKRVKCRNCHDIFEVVALPPKVVGGSDFEIVTSPAAPPAARLVKPPVRAAATKDDGDSDFEIVDSPPAPASKVVKAAKSAVPVPSPVVKGILDDDDEDVPTPRSKPKRRKTEDEDSDDDDENPKKKKSNLLKILLIIGGGMFVLGAIAVVGIVVAMYFLGKAVTDEYGKQPGVPNSGSSSSVVPILVNWVSFDNPTTQYTTAFPGGTPTKLDPLAEITDPQEKKLAQSIAKDATSDSYALTSSGRRYMVNAVVYNAKMAAYIDPKRSIANMETFAKAMYKNATVGPSKPLLVNGHLGKDFVITQNDRKILVRYIVTKDAVYSIRVEGDASMKEDDSTGLEFLEKFMPKAAKGTYTESDFGGEPPPKPKGKK